MPYVISYDLGTGGLKAGLYQMDGSSVQFVFYPYQTYYPKPDWHEQRPVDWWQAVCNATRKLLQSSGVNPKEVLAVSSSGHSLVAAPLDAQGKLLVKQVPIWSDRRVVREVEKFFSEIDYKEWYMTTGNGDPPETYSVFKLMWLKNHFPEIYDKTETVLGSKDYVHYCLTGQMATDYSYASGSGVFDLQGWQYREDFIQASGIRRELFLEPIDSYGLVGEVTVQAARECGLYAGTQVFCGGVDNACMALGTTGIGNGRMYTSLGSSSWIAVSSTKPILDAENLPFIFAHVEKGYYTSGVSIFAAGNTYRWAKDTFCSDFNGNVFEQMNALAATSPVGANGVMFNPSMSGGSSQEPSESLLGGFFGLTLAHTRADLLRSVLEGVALSLSTCCLSVIEKMINADDTMIICGGGAKSDLWMQIFADVYNKKVIVSNVEQDAASLGAAAIALRGQGIWQDYAPLDQLFEVQKEFTPVPKNRDQYAGIAKWFTAWITALSVLHDRMKDNQIEM